MKKPYILRSLILIIMMSFMPAVFAEAQKQSIISLPIYISTAHLEQKLNELIPNRITSIDQKKVCVKAKYAKIFGKKKRISPDIKCRVMGYADKRGRIKLIAKNDHFLISLPIKTKISGRALGISETAYAEATFNIKATPHFDESWQLSLKLDSQYQWDKEPILNLFGVVKVPIKKLVDPKVRQMLDKQHKKIPKIIAKYQIKQKVEKLWSKLQKPILVSKNPSAYLTFKPQFAGFSGFQAERNMVRSNIYLKGVASTIASTVAPKITPTPLLPLKKTKIEKGAFHFNIPLTIPAAAIKAEMKKRFNDEINLKINEDHLEGDFKAENFDIKIDPKDGLILSADIQLIEDDKWYSIFNFFNWFTLSGKAQIALTAKLDTEKNLLIVQSLNVITESDNLLADSLVTALNMSIVKDELVANLQFDYSDQMKRAINKADQKLKTIASKHFDIKTNFTQNRVQDLEFQEDKLLLNVITRGDIELRLKEE